MSVLPSQMLRRWPPMLLWLAGAGYTTFNAPELMATTVVTALMGVGVTLAVYALWGPRTRPRKNAFWFLVHVLLIGAVIVLVGSRPILGAVAAIPVALLWLHDAPASPTAMLVWGVALVLWQPDLWSGAEADIAWTVMMATVLFIAAAQFERNRLAARQFTQAGVVFSLLRILAVTAISMLFIAGRDALRAVNVFTYIGVDASGVSGKIAMLSIIAACIAVAAALFRVRPEKAPRPAVTTARRQVAAGGPVDPRAGPIDFDEPSGKTTQRAADRTVERHRSAGPARGGAAAGSGRGKPAKPAPPARPAKPAAPARSGSGPARPGELDFD